MNMKKKITAVLMSMVMVVTMLPNVAFADEVASGTCGAEGDGDNLTWVLDSDGTLTISGTGAMAANPSWGGHRNDIKTVQIGDGVTNIGESAFNRCYGLASVTIGDGVTSIGETVFNCCENLTSVTIPDSVTSIGAMVFDHCSSLASVIIGNSVTSIAGLAFQCCYALTSVTFLGDAPTNIHKYAFNSIKATAYYHTNNPTWTDDVKKDYDGRLTWVGSCPADTLETIPMKIPTCVETGLTEGKRCTVCDAIVEEQREIPAIGKHIAKSDNNAVPATCSKAGLTASVSCSVCGEELIAQEETEFDSNKHENIVIDEAVAPTYTEKGKTVGVHCSVCNAPLIEQKPVDEKVLKVPTIIKAVNVASGASITWGKVADATDYEVYRGTAKIATVTGTSYIDKQAINGAVNSYKIVAIRKEGTKTATSKPSAVKSVVWIASPQSFAAKNIKGKKIAVSWKKNSKANGYQISYGITGKKAKTVTVNGTSKILSKLTKGKQYTVKICAYKKVSGKTYYSVWQSRTVKVKQ